MISQMALVKFLVFLLPIHLVFLKAKSECREPFPCGNFWMRFPFTDSKDPGCGLVSVDGCDSKDQKPTIRAGGGLGYTVMEQYSTSQMLVYDHLLEAQLKNRSCFASEYTSPLQTPSISFTFSPNLTVYPCRNGSGDRPALDDYFRGYNSIDCAIYFLYYKNSTSSAPTFEKDDIPRGCQLVQLPIKSNPDSDDFFTMLSAEYTLEWNVSQACLSQLVVSMEEDSVLLTMKMNSTAKKVMFSWKT